MIRLYIGKSAAGKDTALKADVKKGFIPIISYTTRPPREKEKDGVDYHFITGDNIEEKNQKFEKMIESDSFIEYKTYNAKRKDRIEKWYYGTPLLENVNDTPYVGVVTIPGAIDIINYFKKNDPSVGIELIYIDLPREIRRQRAEAREPENFDVGEWERRADKDDADFSSEKLNELGALTPILIISDYKQLENLESKNHSMTARSWLASVTNYDPIVIDLGKGYYLNISGPNDSDIANGINKYIYTEVYKVDKNVLKECGGSVILIDEPFYKKYESTVDAIEDTLPYVYSLPFLSHLKENGVKDFPVVKLDQFEYFLVEKEEPELDELS